MTKIAVGKNVLFSTVYRNGIPQEVRFNGKKHPRVKLAEYIEKHKSDFILDDWCYTWKDGSTCQLVEVDNTRVWVVKPSGNGEKVEYSEI